MATAPAGAPTPARGPTSTDGAPAPTSSRSPRQRSERKHAAILAAAQSLFVAEGYERASVDAIAAQAQVSKRTVYDHFGDKRALFQRVLEQVDGAVVATVRAAIEEEITDDRELRESLVAFAARVTTRTFPSPAYATFRRLERQRRTVPQAHGPGTEVPERMLEQRFAELVDAGRLRAADPALAARHFTALTVRLALDALDATPALDALDARPAPDALDASAAPGPSEEDLRVIVTDGVDAFLRAYT